MKILVVSGFWPTRSNPITGIFVVQQVQAYAEAGCEVTVIAPQTLRGRAQRRPYRQILGRTTAYSPTFLDVPQAVSLGEAAVAYNTASCARAIVRTMQRNHIRKSFDGIHIHEMRYGGLSLVRWGREVVGRAIVTLHGFDPVAANLSSQPWFLERTRALWAGSARVVLVGRPLGQYAEKLGVPAEKLSVIHNGAEIPQTWDAHQRVADDVRIVLSVSNLVEWKGIDLNLEALAGIKRDNPGLSWQYEIIGDGPQRVALQSRAKSLGIADHVVFLGRLSYGDTLERMAGCDVFSLPSWREPFGIVYLEAMGQGRPVIGCQEWGAEETVRDGIDGHLVQPKDVASLRQALERLLRNPDRCSAMGAAGRARAEQFTWGKNVRRHLALFASGNTDGCSACST